MLAAWADQVIDRSITWVKLAMLCTVVDAGPGSRAEAL